MRRYALCGLLAVLMASAVSAGAGITPTVRAEEITSWSDEVVLDRASWTLDFRIIEDIRPMTIFTASGGSRIVYYMIYQVENKRGAWETDEDEGRDMEGRGIRTTLDFRFHSHSRDPHRPPTSAEDASREYYVDDPDHVYGDYEDVADVIALNEIKAYHALLDLVRMEDGYEYEGYVITENDETITFLDEYGVTRVLKRDELVDLAPNDGYERGAARIRLHSASRFQRRIDPIFARYDEDGESVGNDENLEWQSSNGDPSPFLCKATWDPMTGLTTYAVVDNPDDVEYGENEKAAWAILDVRKPDEIKAGAVKAMQVGEIDGAEGGPFLVIKTNPRGEPLGPDRVDSEGRIVYRKDSRGAKIPLKDWFGLPIVKRDARGNPVYAAGRDGMRDSKAGFEYEYETVRDWMFESEFETEAIEYTSEDGEPMTYTSLKFAETEPPTLLPGEKLWGVAIWPEIDPYWDYAAIRIRGLRDTVIEVDRAEAEQWRANDARGVELNDQTEGGDFVVEDWVLEIEYRRLGDEFSVTSDTVRRERTRWVRGEWLDMAQDAAPVEDDFGDE
jgi:hypothetical protein